MILQNISHLLWFLQLPIFRSVEHQEEYMLRALELARLGQGAVSPNPLVGCVLVEGDLIIGEGWHRKYGERHAEIMAMDSVVEKHSIAGCTAYVSLEPCSHIGKTPPCADALIKAGVKHVVISTVDTNPLVAGQGIQRLRDAGIDVTTGVLKSEGRRINRRFFTSIEQHIPYIILKWAETADGFVGSQNSTSKWISNVTSRQRAHQWRAEEDAVLVGTRTAQVDNPRLNVRDWSGRNPVRVVIDRSLRLDESLNLFDQSQPTLCYNLKKQEEKSNLTYIKLEKDSFLMSLLLDLTRRNIRSVMVEGGAQTLHAFIQEGLWHEARIFRSVQTFGEGIHSPAIHGQHLREERIEDDRLIVMINPARSIT